MLSPEPQSHLLLISWLSLALHWAAQLVDRFFYNIATNHRNFSSCCDVISADGWASLCFILLSSFSFFPFLPSKHPLVGLVQPQGQKCSRLEPTGMAWSGKFEDVCLVS